MLQGRREGAVSEAELGAFLATHFDRAYRLAWRLLGGRTAAADDVLQEACIAAMRGRARFRGDGSLQTWFFRIVVRRAQTYRRWAALRLRRSDPCEDPDALAGRDDAGDVLLRRRLREAVRRLHGPQRDVFVLVHLEGFTVRETAELTGRAEGTVKSHLHRALAKLRADLADVVSGRATSGGGEAGDR